MTWQIQTGYTVSAVYFFFLPNDGEILWAPDCTETTIPQRHYGDVGSFSSAHNEEPLIPVDLHMAMSLGWVDPATMRRNMPYITDQILAAVALVTP